MKTLNLTEALSREELRALSGYTRPSYQIEWLKKHHIRFFVGADGHPRVLWDHLKEQPRQRVTGPDLAAVRRMGTV